MIQGLDQFLKLYDMMQINTQKSTSKKVCVEGVLSFSRQYQGITISDSYCLEIEIPYEYPHSLPRVLEKKGHEKIQPIADRHINTDHSFCLGIPFEIKKQLASSMDFLLFIRDILEPYLFAQSYFTMHKTWIFGEHAHGFVGIEKSICDSMKIGLESINFEQLSKILLVRKRIGNKYKCPYCFKTKLGQCLFRHKRKVKDLRVHLLKNEFKLLLDATSHKKSARQK